MNKKLLNKYSKGFSIARLKSPKGFTLVELLVAIAIIVILSTVGITSFNTANTRNDLQNQAKEIQSLMRSLRTDSVAALKPITGTSTATSCKSPVPGDPDAGIYYGAWIIFDKADDSFQTGSACVDISNTPLYGTSSKTVLKNGVTFGDFPSGTDREVVLFTFDGDVYSASHPSGDPDPSWVQNPTAAAQVTTPPKSIELISGTSHYYVYFNGSGLVCSQEETPPGTCAN